MTTYLLIKTLIEFSVLSSFFMMVVRVDERLDIIEGDIGEIDDEMNTLYSLIQNLSFKKKMEVEERRIREIKGNGTPKFNGMPIGKGSASQLTPRERGIGSWDTGTYAPTVSKSAVSKKRGKNITSIADADGLK